jgi:hypothetical protein
LTERFLTVLDRLKQQYVLTYESGLPADGVAHRVQINVEVEGRQASDEATFGPLPQPEPTDPTATPTSLPTATPASTPTPLPTPTPTPVSFGVVVATAAKSAWTWFSGILWWVLGFILVVLALILMVSLARHMTRARRERQIAAQEYCAGCGRPLEPDEICLECGANVGRVGAMEFSPE